MLESNSSLWEFPTNLQCFIQRREIKGCGVKDWSVNLKDLVYAVRGSVSWYTFWQLIMLTNENNFCSGCDCFLEQISDHSLNWVPICHVPIKAWHWHIPDPSVNFAFWQKLGILIQSVDGNKANMTGWKKLDTFQDAHYSCD